MKLSEFWLCMEHEFGRGYARVLAADLVLGQLGQLTALEALEKALIRAVCGWRFAIRKTFP